MKLINRVITDGYWGAYYLVYVSGVAFLLYHSGTSCSSKGPGSTIVVVVKTGHVVVSSACGSILGYDVLILHLGVSGISICDGVAV